MEDPNWIKLRKVEGSGGSMWRRFKHALGYNQWYYGARKKVLHKLQNKRKTKPISKDPDESQKLLDDQEDHMNDSDSGNGKSWSNQLVYNMEARLRRSGSYPPPGSKRRGGYKPSTFKDKEIDVWISVNRVRNGTQESGGTLGQASTYSFPSAKLEQFRRTSLNESSIDKYNRLFGSSFGKERILQTSKSLRVRKEQEIPLLPLRRLRSLSSAESINMHQIESPRSASSTDRPLTLPEGSNRVKITSLVEEKSAGSDAKTEKIVSVNDEVGLNLDDISEKDYEELIILDMSDSYRKEEDIINLFSLDMNSNSETCFQEEVSTSAGSQILEGSEDKCNNAKGEDFAINSNESLEDFAVNLNESLNTGSISPQKFQTLEKACQHNPDVSYIKDLLERSGFNTVNFFNGKMYLREQLLNPSLFKEMEAFWHPEASECYHNRMIFDLVNEVLVHMCDRSFTYYPKALSSSCRVRSLPPGNLFMQEVYGSISSLLRLKSEVKKSTDGIVGLDLEKDDAWMNLQLESEDVALELEDITFGDLLDELIFDDLLDELSDDWLENL